jgi:hypothetical protein
VHATNLLQVIHQRWAAATALNAALPAELVYTGNSGAPGPPYVLLNKESQRVAVSYNSGASLVKVTLSIQVFHPRHDAAAAIVEQIAAAFDRTQFALAGNDKVIHMRRTNDTEQQNSSGVWQMTAEFVCMIHLAAQT